MLQGRLRFERADARRREIARDAANAGAVRSVRRDRDLDHGIVEACCVDEALPDLVGQSGVELDDAGMVVGKVELALGEHHAVRIDAPHRQLLERDAGSGNVTADRPENADQARLRVGRATNDFDRRLARLDLDLANLELVRVGMLLRLHDARDREGAQRLGRVLDAFHLEPDR